MGEKVDDGLGLSLSLGCGGGNANNSTTLPSSSSGALKLKPSLMAGHGNPMQFLHQPQAQLKPSHWNDIFRLSSDRTPAPAKTPARDYDEENRVSSPNSTVSSLSGKGSERSELVGEETEGERDSCSRGSDDEDGLAGDAARKKLRLTKEQALVLEETFKDHNTLNPKQKQALAKQLNLRPRQVEVWFQNRRARTKLKQTEVDCEYLKRCCENLTDENRRLQKEVQELRALKLSPQLYMHMTPPTTLTMCPSCERVSPGGPARQGRSGPVGPWATRS